VKVWASFVFCLFFFFLSKQRKEIGICFLASVAVDDVHISWFEDNQVENDGTDKKCLLCLISLFDDVHISGLSHV
jgi:elongation factor P--beta-lysine ligase